MENNHSRFFIIIIFCLLAIASSLPISVPMVNAQSFTSTSSQGTKTPILSTSTPSQTYTITVSPSVTPTTTLEPLPEITLQFPIPTGNSIPSIAPKSTDVTSTPYATAENLLLSINPRMKIIGILITALWLFLTGFLVIYIRQIK